MRARGQAGERRARGRQLQQTPLSTHHRQPLLNILHHTHTNNSSVEAVVAALPHDTHPMAVLLTGLAALSGAHPEQNPALAGDGVYRSRAVQDKQVARLVGKVGRGGG